MKLKPIALAATGILGVCLIHPTFATSHDQQAVQADNASVAQKMAAMQARIDDMQKQLDAMRQAQSGAPAASAAVQPVNAKNTAAVKEVALAQSKPAAKKDGIKLGGAVRFQYSSESYNKGNQHRGGDGDFDIFRLDLNGTVGGVELSAQYRWFQYMSAIQHAWVGYKFSDTSEGRLGITKLPFGVQPFDSHNYFFSSNYYLSLEDSYKMGVKYLYTNDPWNVQLAFFKNDSMGGVDGYVGNRSDSYTYNVVGVRSPGEGIYADPLSPIGTVNTAAARVAYTFKPGADTSIEVGGSGLHGGLNNSTSSVGHYDAYALHMNAYDGPWNLQLQAARYNYAVDHGATRLAVGAYHFYDSIAARANSYTGNIAYKWPVSWGPITTLTFYNDYSMISHKSGGLPHTWMNVSGVSVAAGGLFTYFDFVTARNQPFIGGSMAGNGNVEHRFNINFGYYF
jgi:phosphate-selective porin